MKIIHFGLNTSSENKYFGEKMSIENKLYYISLRKFVAVVKTTCIAQKIHVLVKNKSARLTLDLEGPYSSKQNQIAHANFYFIYLVESPIVEF